MEQTKTQSTQNQTSVAKLDAGYKSSLIKTTELFTNMMINSFKEMSLDYTPYQKRCVVDMISKMNELLTKESLSFKDVDSGNITSILNQTAMLQLDIAASPRECYIQFRNVKIGDVWKKTFEFGIEGNGNDALLRRFGADVKTVINPWIIHEGDEFTYPAFNGLEMTNPTWTPKSYTGKVIRVVYPVIKTTGEIEWLISEREEVAKNLKAHITNNCMKDKTKQAELIEKTADMTLDELLSDKSLRDYISPAWYNSSSREDMILRKLKNNATKKYPKNFESAYIESAYEDTYEDYDQYREDNNKVKEHNADKLLDNEVDAAFKEKEKTSATSEPTKEQLVADVDGVLVESKAPNSEEYKEVTKQSSKSQEVNDDADFDPYK